MSIETNRLINIIQANKNKKINAQKVIESVPNNLTILPKLIQSSDSKIRMSDDETNLKINRSLFEQLHRDIGKSKKDSEYIIQLFPDIELSIQILVSSILSPKNMLGIGLNFKLDKNIDLPPSVTSSLLEKIKVVIMEEYKLENILPDILRESLFESGAYILAVIPESSVDNVINSDILSSYSNENLKLSIDTSLSDMTVSKNILKIDDDFINKKVSDLSVKEKLLYELVTENFKITDNYNIFKYSNFNSKLKTSVIKKSIRNKSSISTEDLDIIKYSDIFRNKNINFTNKQVEIIKTKNETNRVSINKPMVMKLNTESVIPVITPNNPSDHIGYFVLLDENGHPLTYTGSMMNKELSNNLFNSNDKTQSSSIIEKAYSNLITSNSETNLIELFNSYKDIIEHRLYKTITDSIYGSDIKIENKNEVYFMMFSRALAEQKTTIVFIPSELVSYIAFYYNKTGTGKSLLENLNILSSLRAITLFAKIMAYSKMSIDVTKVNIGLDPEDPDPEKSIEMIQDSVLKLRQNYFPLGINNPMDLVDWIHRAGLQFTYDSIPGLPNVKIDFESSNLEHNLPESDLEETLRKQTIMSLGLSPEVVDSGFTPEFATSVVNNNILLSKRVLIYQNKLTEHLNKFNKMILTNDEDLRLKIRNIIEENLDKLTIKENELYKNNITKFYDTYIDKIANSLFVELPKPENTNLNNLSAEFTLYKDNLEIILDSILSTEVISQELSGELNNSIDSIKTAIKHYLLRQWCASNNYYSEALDFTKNQEEKYNSLLENVKEDIVTIMNNSTQLFKLMSKFKEASNITLNKEEKGTL